MTSHQQTPKTDFGKFAESSAAKRPLSDYPASPPILSAFIGVHRRPSLPFAISAPLKSPFTALPSLFFGLFRPFLKHLASTPSFQPQKRRLVSNRGHYGNP
jgi:hypothetical protein